MDIPSYYDNECEYIIGENSWCKFLNELPADEMDETEDNPEFLIRCKGCQFCKDNEAPQNIEYPHFCIKHKIDMKNNNGYCSWAKPRYVII